MRELTPEEKTALLDVAAALKVDPRTLAAEIQFESRWNPRIKNPGSSARGLIQFMDTTAREMGFDGSLDLVLKFPTVPLQLRGPVLRYLKRYAPFPTDQSLFMSVFYPAFRNVDPETEFPERVQAANPGIERVSDYVEHVWNRVGEVSV